MRIMRRSVVLLLLLLAVSAFPTRANVRKVVVISNSVDRPAALKLVTYLMMGGVPARTGSPSEFSSLIKSGEVGEIMVLGGPDAYQGVGNISSELMNRIDQSYLRKNRGAAVIRRYGFFIGGRFKDIVIIAGSTREETKLCAELYAALGFPGSLVYPEVVSSINRGSKKSLIYVHKRVGEGEINTTVIRVSYFSGEVEGSPGEGYSWSYEIRAKNHTAEILNYNVFLKNGKYCHRSSVKFNRSQEHTQWKCSPASSARIRKIYGDAEFASAILGMFLKVENRTVPAGTFRCVVEERPGLKVWLSPEVPLTRVVAAESEAGDVKISLELRSVEG